MKTKIIGKTVYIVKVWHTDEEGNLTAHHETWINKERAKRDFERKEALYGEDNVFVYKANQCMFE